MTSSARPSMYFSNSQASRDFPMPPIPTTETRLPRRSSAEAWKSSLTSRSSRSRPTNGGSRPADFEMPPRSPTTRTARHSGTGSVFPLSVCVPASSKTIAASAVRFVVSPTKTEPGSAADWIREAVLTRSPATMPWPSAPSVTAASPVSTPARARRPAAPTSAPSAPTASRRSSAARTARSGSSSCATGAPQTAMTASPMNFSTVPP